MVRTLSARAAHERVQQCAEPSADGQHDGTEPDETGQSDRLWRVDLRKMEKLVFYCYCCRMQWQLAMEERTDTIQYNVDKVISRRETEKWKHIWAINVC